MNTDLGMEVYDDNGSLLEVKPHFLREAEMWYDPIEGMCNKSNLCDRNGGPKKARLPRGAHNLANVESISNADTSTSSAFIHNPE